jgi:hypothetical protein
MNIQRITTIVDITNTQIKDIGYCDGIQYINGKCYATMNIDILDGVE